MNVQKPPVQCGPYLTPLLFATFNVALLSRAAWLSAFALCFANTAVVSQTFQPLSHANLEVLKTSPEKPGDWDLKPGDFQNMCQIIKKALFV